MAEEKKRRTTTSSDVKARYNKKTYVQYTLNFRKDTDSDLIEMIEAERNKGFSTADAFRNLLHNKSMEAL